MWKNVKLLQSCRKLNEQLSTTSFLPPKEGFLSCSTFKKQLILHQGTTAIPSLPSTKDLKHNLTFSWFFYFYCFGTQSKNFRLLNLFNWALDTFFCVQILRFFLQFHFCVQVAQQWRVKSNLLPQFQRFISCLLPNIISNRNWWQQWAWNEQSLHFTLDSTTNGQNCYRGLGKFD